MKYVLRGLAALALLGSMSIFQGCEVDSANEVQRTVGVDFTGFYRNPNTSPQVTSTGSGTNKVVVTNAVSQNVTSRNSGTPISSLDLRQGGDRLEAVDNTGNIWTGSLGEFNGASSSFELVGRTTAGTEGRFSGTLSTTAGSTLGTMTGTYIEDAFYGTFYATASIPGVSPDSGGVTNVNTNTNFVVNATFDAKFIASSTLPPRLWFMRQGAS